MIYRKLFGKDSLKLSALGLGCMGISEFYGESDMAESAEVITEAYNLGINFFDTADVYGYGENEKFVGKMTSKFRDKIILATKCGIIRKLDDPKARGISNSPEYIQECCDASLKRLNMDYIDLYYLHRFDVNTSVEDSVGALSDLVKEGKIKHIGLSEFSADNIRKAQSIHPISAVQSEYSLWTRVIENNGVLDVCREFNIALVAYSPLGRGFLTGKVKNTNKLSEDDFRKTLPRFQQDVLQGNLKLVSLLEEMAVQKNCMPSQLAIAWLLAQDDLVIPIPGTKRLKYLRENVDAVEKVKLNQEDLKYLDEISKKYAPVGSRYSAAAMKAYGFDE